MQLENRLFPISDQQGINRFEPRPSPFPMDGITGGVVFAISGTSLHNYLLPRDCPRVTCFVRAETTEVDRQRFFGESTADYIITVPAGWCHLIETTVRYGYESKSDNFILVDDCAGYSVFYVQEKPIAVSLIAEILCRNAELRLSPAIIPLSEAVCRSSLGFSLIGMRNAKI